MVGRDEEKLRAVVRENGAGIRSNVRVLRLAADEADRFAARMTEAGLRIDDIEALVIPMGMSRDDDDGLVRSETMSELFQVNLFAVHAIVRSVLPHMAAKGRGAIVVFSSVAVFRSRSRNVGYTAAKNALESLCESWRHQFLAHGVRIITFRLGYVRTERLQNQKMLLPAASPQKVASVVLKKLRRGNGVVVYPRFWIVVGYAIRLVPEAIFRRMRF
jgi:short-subunit dehydrogenase